MKTAAMIACTCPSAVMAGLVPVIHPFLEQRKQDVDARDKRGHDVPESITP
jgi:hypothetical protein